MNVGVTGAAGFVGGHIVEHLRIHGHTVTALVRSGSEPASRPFDLAVRPLPHGLLDGLDALVHCAAYLPVSYADPAEAQRCMDINALGTLAVLQECARAGVHTVVHLSTNLYRFSLHPVTEDAAFEPSAQAAFYLVSKAAADFFVGQFSGQLAVKLLRLGSVYGRGLTRGLIATLTDKLIAGTPITVEDSGYQADFVEVSDVAAAVVAAVEREVTGPFNLGSGVATRPLEIAEHLLAESGAPRALLQVTPASQTPRGFSALEPSRARALLGFSPRNLADGLRDYVAWRRSR